MLLQIPADMVVNSMIVAMMAHADQKGRETIYQIGSSVSNPLNITNLRDYGFNYFRKNPWINKVNGKPIIVGKVNVLSSMDSFQRYMALHYILPLKVCFISQLFKIYINIQCTLFIYWIYIMR